MKISKDRGIRALSDPIPETEKISYCPRCLKFGAQIILGERIYKSDEPYRESDKELFRQCPDCGKIVPTHETKKESELEGFVETSDNPFDEGKSIVGLDNRLPKSKIQKERKRLVDRAKEKDSEIRRELLKGNIIDSIQDY